MKELNVYDTLIQNEALINELKGNLFEFLVGRELAVTSNLEGQFLSAIPEDFHERLRGYENWLRDNSEELLTQLPSLAKETVGFFRGQVKEELTGVLVVGKLAGGNHDQRLGEADLLVKTNTNLIPISLKLCKEKSFVNTKSAGVRSFISKYFGHSFQSAKKRQEKLNQSLDNHYIELSKKLHLLGGLGPEPRFGEAWFRAGLPELPGQLNPEMNSALKEHYHEMILLFFETWQELLLENKNVFLDSMMPLLGFGLEEINQLSCFYSGKYNFSYGSYKGRDLFRKALNDAELRGPKDGLSSFEMVMNDCIFQVRLKPMNKFTVSGLKVNCSLKQDKSC